ncbi:hypothetical protein BJP49_10760 [Paenibacillus odorifer]|nr:hypothetical protein BJP49_10760 [Paenibacillus odorifer]
MFVCLAKLRVIIMFFDMRGEAQFLDLLFTVSPGHSSGIRLERRRFSLSFAIRLHGGRLLIGEVHTKYAPCERAIASASSLEATPSFSPLSPVNTTSNALICSLIYIVTKLKPLLKKMIKLSYMEHDFGSIIYL